MRGLEARLVSGTVSVSRDGGMVGGLDVVGRVSGTVSVSRDGGMVGGLDVVRRVRGTVSVSRDGGVESRLMRRIRCI